MIDAVLLNIAGGEWLVIVLAALILLLGTNRLPDAARKMGRIAAEYDKARKEISEKSKGVGGFRPTGEVSTEREKLDLMADTLGILREGKTDEELRRLIAESVGKKAGG